MFELVFLFFLVLEIYLLVKYFNTLTKVSTIDLNEQKSLGLTMAQTELTNYMLLKDVKFFLCLITKSYANADIDTSLKETLDTARRYLLIQYPVAIALFLTPTLFK